MGRTPPIIETIQLTKTYGGGKDATRALEYLDLQVHAGEIFGYLGPNGAGKTTTIRLLLDFIRPTEGRALLFGRDTREHYVDLHRRVGFLPGELNLWKNQTGLRIVRYLARLRNMPDTTYALTLAERLSLDLNRRVRDYSSGNRRKLGLVIALMSRPPLLILDEPTNGLDPLMQQEFNHVVSELREQGCTVFLSSHILGEVQAICDRVAILRDGRLRAVESVARLMHVDFRWVEMHFRDPVPRAWEIELARVPGVSDLAVEGRGVRLRLTGAIDPLLRAVSAGYMETIRVQEPALEDIFLTYYGNGARAGLEMPVKEVVR